MNFNFRNQVQRYTKKIKSEYFNNKIEENRNNSRKLWQQLKGLGYKNKPEDHWSCIAHLIAEDVLISAVIEEKKFKNIECK